MAKIETKIGKDVIESLTLGMYEDSRFIYREYIQNSADQIDKAVEEGLFSSLREGKIEISIKRSTRSISVFDNATGIETSKVQSLLKNIAQSTKDRNKNKGFRGIGRLGGLAYCDKLIFETSYMGENVKSILTWDSQKLKSIINNRSTKEEATAVIDDVTEFVRDSEHTEAHYFRVTLKGVSNDGLLDKDDVYEYLTMVAPVPYAKGFIFKNKVLGKAKELNYHIDEYSIFVNRGQVYKKYTSSVYEGDKSNKKKIDEIHDIETFEIKNNKDKLLGWGWYSISSLIKQMPKVNIARSIRLRKGNIQIGMEDALDRLFKDARWSRYYFGEIHVVSSDLIPNSRRDYFLESAALDDFEKLVKSKFLELEKLNYLSSNLRSNQKKIEAFVSFADEYEHKSTKGGFTNDKEKQEYTEKFEEKKAKAEIAKKELEKAKEKSKGSSSSQKKVYDKVIGDKEQNIDKVASTPEKGKTKYITDSIVKLNRKERKLVSRIYEVIDNVLPKEIGGVLKEKIKEEFNK
jgi:molecular chaperone HtpG